MFCPCYSTRHTYWKNQGSIDPAMLRTCKSVQNEAMPILYSGNTFQLMCRTHNPLHRGFIPDEQRLLSSPNLQARTYIRKAVAEIHFGDYREEYGYGNLRYLSDLEALLTPQYPHLQQLTIRAESYYTRVSVEAVMQRGNCQVGSLNTYKDALSSLLLKVPLFDPYEWWETAAPRLFSFLMRRNTYDVKAFKFYLDGEPLCENPEDFLRATYGASP